MAVFHETHSTIEQIKEKILLSVNDKVKITIEANKKDWKELLSLPFSPNPPSFFPLPLSPSC